MDAFLFNLYVKTCQDWNSFFKVRVFMAFKVNVKLQLDTCLLNSQVNCTFLNNIIMLQKKILLSIKFRLMECKLDQGNFGSFGFHAWSEENVKGNFNLHLQNINQSRLKNTKVTINFSFRHIV